MRDITHPKNKPFQFLFGYDELINSFEYEILYNKLYKDTLLAVFESEGKLGVLQIKQNDLRKYESYEQVVELRDLLHLNIEWHESIDDLKRHPNLLILKDNRIIGKGDLIDISCKSYRFLEQPDGTSQCIVEGDDGIHMFLENLPEDKGILVAEKEGSGSYFIYTGPDRVSQFGLHQRKPDITLPKLKKIKAAKPSKKKTPHPSGKPPIGKKSRGRPKGSKNKKK